MGAFFIGKAYRMDIIWKFPLVITDVQTVDIPDGGKILCVQNQGGVTCLWVLCEKASPKSTRTFYIYGTGNPIKQTPGKYIGTVQNAGGALIWHVFEKQADSK